MANEINPESKRPASRRGETGAPVQRSTVEARQGRTGGRVLLILLTSLVLLAVAYFVILGYFWNAPH
jgi:hypothetical protein